MSDCTNCGEYCGHSHQAPPEVMAAPFVPDPDPEMTRALGRQWLEGHRVGFAQASAVALDLIAELRACPVLPTTREDLEPLRNMADRAEARLREVQGE